MTLNKFLRWTAIASVFSLCIVPFIVSESLFFPYIVGKNLFFRVIVEIGFAAWLLLALRDSSARPRLSALLWSFVAFTGVMGLATVFGENAWKSFFSNFERMEGYITVLHLFAYFVMAATVLNTERLWTRFLQTSIGASLIVSAHGLLQLAGATAINQGGNRLDATLGNAIYLAVYMLFNMFFAAILFARDRSLWKRVAYGAVILIQFVVLYNTGTRGTVFGLLAGTLVTSALVALFDKADKRRRIIASAIIGAAIVLVGTFLAIRNTGFVTESPILSRFASISFQGQGRSYIWPMAIDGFKEKPMLGWGQENFNYVFNAHYNPAMYGQEQWFDRAHNVFLDWLIAGGLLGLMGYLALYVSGVWLLWKKGADVSFGEKALLTGLGTAYFVHSLFVFDNITSYISFVSVLAFIHFRSTRLAHPVASKAPEVEGITARAVGVAVLVALSFSLSFFNWKAYAAGRELLDGLRAVSVDPIDPQLALDSFKASLEYNTIGRAETIERLIEAAQKVNSSGAPIAIRQGYYEMGRDALEAQLARAPGDARYELFAGVFYSSYGHYDKAEAHFLEAQRLSPTKQTIIFALGSLYLNTKEYDKAIAVFKQAYDLETSNRDAGNYYAIALIYAGREAEARAFLKQAFGSDDMTGDVFLRAYVNSADWANVIKIFRARIVANPTDMSLRQNLAAAYVQAGDKANAISVIREMIKLVPDFKAQGEDYIRQIEALGR